MTRTIVVAAVAGLVMLAGCDSSTEPAAPPTSEDALTTPTEEPSEDTEVTSEPAETSEEATSEEPDADRPPEMPAVAAEQTEEGAEAFAEHYISTLNWAYMTGDTTASQTLSDSECESCAGLIAEAAEYQTEGDYVRTERTSALLSSDGARVEVTIEQLSGAGAGEAEIVVRLRPSEEAWLVDEITIVE
ncbi:hypothetical protein BJF86_09525 [Serinicoccus sp. CNJ-927]|uniref:DUF6318 family protein n=1 Tax=Serinicoccus sp. CNJ-927 TaxID=1904970 RepID=UPI00095B951F|nr:DUF6318 family protein [Serinicoccus sp. CNJ-927]OLT39244.1 hypothetical protein BJF86_09525 [Serinicoccus sp. CNJ-927]